MRQTRVLMGEWLLEIWRRTRGRAPRLRRPHRIILAGDRPRLERWDPDEVAKVRKDCDRDAGALVAELVELREESVALAASLVPEDLERIGLHPTIGALSVRDVLQEWVHDDRNHLKQMMTTVHDYAWPHMGNAQGFSAAPPARG